MFHIRRLPMYAVLALLLCLAPSWGLAGQTEPSSGGTLVVPQTYSAHVSMDPLRLTLERAEDIQVVRQFMEGLVKMNHNLKVEPAIAESWEVDPDGLTYTFNLRGDVTFHQGYGPVKAEDFKYSFERLMNPEMDAAPTKILSKVEGVEAYSNGQAEHISGIRVVDEHTLKISLKERDIFFLEKLAQPACTVVPQKAVEEMGKEFSKSPVSAGPFQFVKWEGKVITLKAFEDYYAGRPYLDRVVFKDVLEPGTRRAAFEAEELDLTILTASQYVDYLKNPKYKDNLLEVPELWTRHLLFNTKWGPLQDKRVRQAVGYAIDAEQLVKSYCRNKAFPATGYLSKGLPAFNPELEGYPYDPDKARALLKEAGYPDGFDLEIMGAVGARSWGAPLAVAFKSYLEKVGIRVTVDPVESATRHQRTDEGDFQAKVTSFGGTTSSVEYIGRFVGSNTRAQGNDAAYSNPEFDKLIEEASMTVDQDKRIALVREAEKIFMEDLPTWPFNYNKAVMAHQSWVHGLQKMPQDLAYQDYSEVWVEKSSPRK
ncbi:MAG: ABC transporter substrate-binding protein [Desulfohalobiaceae bacterium]|nr:ABC transporter substrate-binding protein [Desulfohalobiaceae bacterium]